MPFNICNENQVNSPRIIAVGSGKGGVGKTTIAVNLARAFQKIGKKVGLLDADFYTPSLAHMISCSKAPIIHEDGKVVLGEAEGMKVISAGYLMPKNQPLILRAPQINKLIGQFTDPVIWKGLDVIVVDFPPGTGDIQITLLQKMPFQGAIIVTTPQKVAQEQVARAATMFQFLKVPLIGVVENMSYYPDGNGDKKYLFGQGGGKDLAANFSCPLVAEIALSADLCRYSDLGLSPFQDECKEGGPLREIFLLLANTLFLEKRSELQYLQIVEQRKVSLSWSDGTSQEILVHWLLKNCPCVECQNQSEERSVPESRVMGATKIGNYAVQFSIEGGCSKGIYSYELLRKNSRS